jgi:tetratricopeptide (TPR) repeat protein
MNTRSYETPSTSYKKPKRKLIIWSIIGGVGLILLLSFWFGRDTAAAQLAKSADNLSAPDKERYLVNLSTASWRTDSAQKALAEYYKTQQNFAKAAQAYHDGSASLRPNAAAMYAEAGEYDKAIIILKSLTKKQPENHTFALALALINDDQTTDGCKLQEQISGDDSRRLARLCELVEKDDLTRKDVYELYRAGVDSIVEKYFAKSTQMSVDDWLTLARIYQKRGDIDKASESLEKGMDTFPYSSELLTAKQSLQ